MPEEAVLLCLVQVKSPLQADVPSGSTRHSQNGLVHITDRLMAESAGQVASA